MLPPNSSLFLLIILSIAVQTYSQFEDQNTPFLNLCEGESFNSSSPYNLGRRHLVDKLITSTPNSPSFFSLINSTSPDIFGLAQCRPDITPVLCTACLNQSAALFFNIRGCSQYMSFANRAGNCLIRYSDQMFYKVPDDRIFFYPNDQNASAYFNRQVNIFMNSVLASAAAAVLRFGTGVTNESVDAQHDMYGMGWCTMDLASSDCYQCLSSVLASLPAWKNSGIAATASCYVRFDTFKFYSSPLLLSAPEPAQEPAREPAAGKKTMIRSVAISLPIGLVIVLVTITYLILKRKRRDKGISRLQGGTELALRHKIREGNSDFSLMSFSTIVKATCNFSDANKLGQGGFGSVYKGQLPEGESIAVKRLDSCSGQGLEEFMNEIKLIARLQHKNLVKLLGCCVERDEKLLVYEYMPNNSLEYHLFGLKFSDLSRREQLDWPKRFAIIDGIAQGLLYLHEYSRVRIVHRDLKASNILLDPEMKPKISDFGMARIFDANTTQANTNRIVGTYGYMSPEYAMEGLFSIKSDVFSFGVLMLEIISGKRNTSFHKSGKALNLLAHAWELWKNDCWLDFVDPSLGDKVLKNDLLKCIIVALMCVQEHVIDRPIMSEIIAMLGSENIALPDPKKPAFFIGANESASEISSQNDLTLTVLEGR